MSVLPEVQNRLYNDGETGEAAAVFVAAEPMMIEEIEKDQMNEERLCPLKIGDHVFQWRSLCGIPYVFQHHGIVMDVINDSETGEPIRITIADFSNVETKQKSRNIVASENYDGQKRSCDTENGKIVSIEECYINGGEQEGTVVDPAKNDTEHGTMATVENVRSCENVAVDGRNIDEDSLRSEPASASLSANNKQHRRRSSLEKEGILRTYTDSDISEWHKVNYEAPFWKRQIKRSGTATKVKSDPVGLVLARVNFIIRHPDLLPNYHVVHANCECVAFWCKTGRWSTLQASSFLELTAAGQVKQCATLAGAAAAATTQITVPSAGIFGWFGATTTQSVSWLSLHPMAIPGLACYAAITVGVPAIIYVSAQKQWNKTSRRLIDAFWESATENPAVFAECITHWSDKNQ